MSVSVLDTTGLVCPEPVMMLHNSVRGMAEGMSIKVIASDPSTKRDIPKFCTFLQHTLLCEKHDEANNRYIYEIRKGIAD